MNAIALLPGLLLAGGIPREPLTCTVAPRVVEVGSFYNGTAVRVEGRTAAGSQLVVTVTGSDREERFTRKERVGPIWLNSGKLRISGAPSLFLRYSTGPVAAMLGEDAMARDRLDERSLMARMRIEPQSPERPGDSAIRNDYVALRKSGGTYVFGNGGIVVKESGGSPSFALDIRWPKRAPPATYEVRVYEVVQGAIVREASATLSVVRTGFPAWLAGMAANRAPLYGVVAVLIAALAGFGIDRLSTLLLGKKRTVAH
jgi:hypothetical protein